MDDKRYSQKCVRSARNRIEFDSEKCIWCRSCEVICSLYNESQCRPSAARIRVFLDLFEQKVEAHICRQCENPECLRACTSGAIQVDSATRAIIIQESQCKACGLCAEACPYNDSRSIIAFNAERNVFVKCDLCNGKPQCVEICPSNALKYTQV